MLFSKEINRQKKCQTLPFEKQRRSQNLSEKYTVFLVEKIWRSALDLKSKKVQGIFGEIIILAWMFSAVFRLQNHVSYFL